MSLAQNYRKFIDKNQWIVFGLYESRIEVSIDWVELRVGLSDISWEELCKLAQKQMGERGVY